MLPRFQKKRKKKKKTNEKPIPSPQNKIEFILIVRALAVCQVAWKGKDDFLSGFWFSKVTRQVSFQRKFASILSMDLSSNYPLWQAK